MHRCCRGYLKRYRSESSITFSLHNLILSTDYIFHARRQVYSNWIAPYTEHLRFNYSKLITASLIMVKSSIQELSRFLKRYRSESSIRLKSHVLGLKKTLCYLIIIFSSKSSWSSCMLDAPEKSQPYRFYKKNQYNTWSFKTRESQLRFLIGWLGGWWELTGPIKSWSKEKPMHSWIISTLLKNCSNQCQSKLNTTKISCFLW